MKISPLDIRKQRFKKALRGVDPEEVRMFLEVVASEYEKVLQENAMMSEKIRYQEERLEEYRELEKSMRNSLVTADRIANESREASEREASRIIQDAHTRAERILEDSRERLQRLVQDVESLRSKKEIYVRRFRTMLDAQLSVLSEQEQQFDEINRLEDSAHHLMDASRPLGEDSGWRDEREKTFERPPSRSVPPRDEAIDERERKTDSLDSRGAFDEGDDDGDEETWETAEERQAVAPRRAASMRVIGSSRSDRADESLFSEAEPTSEDEEPASEEPESTSATFAEPDRPSEKRGMAEIRGVGRFFKRSQASLAFEDGRRSRDSGHDDEGEDAPEEETRSVAEAGSGSTDDEDDHPFFPVQERSEGFFEINAEERRRR